jgi:hypothetical protein
MKYSTNGGSSWNYNSSLDLSIGSNLCNGIDAIYEPQIGVHLVWATLDSDPSFETYYYRLTPSDSWADPKNVTDYNQYEVGGAPSVTYSQNRVHVSYNLKYSNQYWGGMKSRDRDNGSWQTPQFISTLDEGMGERLVVRGSNLYVIYGQYESPSYNNLLYKSRTLSGSWTTGSGTVIEYGIMEDPNSFNVLKTSNDKLQLVYDDGGNFLHRSFDGSWSGAYTLDGNQTFASVQKGLSSTSNDFFVAWKRYGNSNIFYKQYDDYPLAPQGLDVQPYQQGNTLMQNLPGNSTMNRMYLLRRTTHMKSGEGYST